jgi:type VI secretion system protein ImpK
VRDLPPDDVISPVPESSGRNPMMRYAAPVLALAASVRTGRAELSLQALHSRASTLIAAFDRAVVEHGYSDQQRQRARYAVCATIDDIAQNLPGSSRDGSAWARDSMVVRFFQENVGGERFWQLVDDMLARPAEYGDAIELFHACLAAGFEGRYRVAPDGRRGLQDVMTQLYAAMDHVRSLSTVEISPRWRGVPTPAAKPGFWSVIIAAAAAASVLMLVVYLIFRVILGQTGQPAIQAMDSLSPDEPLRLSRAAPPPPQPASGQLQTLQAFLAPEIRQGLVKVEQDAQTVRVRTTVGQLFASGSDRLEPGRDTLFARIAEAIDKTQRGAVRVEGYTDSDRPRGGLTFPDNVALSEARANTVAQLMRRGLSDPGRLSAQGYGASRPIASNATAEGKSLNRRVEIVVPRAG